MFQQFTNFRRQSGISLLELMLSLAIIAVILTMATRFYGQANQNQNLNNAVSMANGLAGAMQTYRMNISNTGDVTIDKLIKTNQLPQDFGGSDGNGKGANPWGGDLVLDAKSGAVPTISFTSVPTVSGTTENSDTCHILAYRLSKTFATATCESGTVTFNPVF